MRDAISVVHAEGHIIGNIVFDKPKRIPENGMLR
jgi:hypothetical protein